MRNLCFISIILELTACLIIKLNFFYGNYNKESHQYYLQQIYILNYKQL